MIRDNRLLVWFVPLLLFGLSVWVFVQTENWAGVQFARAKSYWRGGEYAPATELFLELYEEHPESAYADDALWELAEIHYVNLYDVARAVLYLEKLSQEYGSSPLRVDALLKLAEIHEVELNDTEKSIECVQAALSLTAPSQQRRIAFRLAGLYLKQDRFEEAFSQFEGVAAEIDDELAEQSLIRMGAIQQIRRNPAGSLPFFERVLAHSHCGECRIRAQLGLIESYEFLDNLPKAIEVAQSIDAAEYSQVQKEALILQLEQKRRLYAKPGDTDPLLWNGQ